jgi:hypothetical protein
MHQILYCGASALVVKRRRRVSPVLNSIVASVSFIYLQVAVILCCRIDYISLFMAITVTRKKLAAIS